MHKYFFLILSLILSIKPAYAQNERYTSVEIIPEQTHNIKAGESITLATVVNLAPEWHVYWINPGDSGLPVRITWTAPEGVTIDPIQWPAPDKISYDILANYGYYDTVKLLQKIHISSEYKNEPIHLTASVEMLVCKEICIPESDTVSITLNDPSATIQNNAATIQNAKNNLPKPFSGSVTYSEENEKLHLHINTNDKALNTDNLDFFPYEWGVIKYTSTPQLSQKDGKTTISHDRDDRDLSELESLKGLIIIKGEKGRNKGFEITASRADPQGITTTPSNAKTQKTAESITQSSSLTWASAIGLALLGGLILNLMPCVFPVLSMKALSLVKMGEKEKKQARTYGVAYTLGVVLSFMLMGVILIVLQKTGSAIGWGFQLQNPIIVTILAYLLFTIGMSLMGFFDFGTSLGNIGGKLTQGSSTSSSFFTGALVTFVAAPCIGPFLGAAMGYAITQPPLYSITFFAALGLGLASPYLMLSFVPATRTLLPKPGAWMNTFKQLLAFPMFASAIIFIWVLSQQSGTEAALLAMLGLLFISFTIWLLKLPKRGVITLFFIGLSLITIVTTLVIIKRVPPQNMSKSESAFGKPFSQTTLNEALKTNKPVFVEMTAAWCFTCKINHAVAININTTKELFKQKNVQYLIGDWTNHDKNITEYLAQYGRNGVPLYVYYAPPQKNTGKRPEPLILPQVLTPGIVQQALGQ